MKYIVLTLLLIAILNNVFGIENNKIITITPDMRLIQLGENFYIHESTTNSSQFGRFSSNGLLVIKNGKALMIDTPVTNEETKTLTTYLKDSMNATLTTFIGGHFHIDCVGGMGFLKEKGVKCILGSRTREKCVELNLPLPDLTFEKEFDFSFEGIKTECRYFGGGHTADNIVVFFPNARILFGGCLIKNMQAPNLGNLQDATVPEWITTVQKIKDSFPDIHVVVPGHGAFGGSELLDHTISLVKLKIETKE